jgi:sugar lactone lactonase YvrE
VHSATALDDFAFDARGNLYGMTNSSNTVVRIAPDGTSEVLLTLTDGLDGPTSGAFGVKKHKKDLYIANGAFPAFSGQNPRRPSVMRLHIGIKGEPRP